MKIGGIQKMSLGDYPGKLSAAVFTIGCNMRCGYCHNPELVLPERFSDSIPVDIIMDFFKSRVGKLEGIVISGGEPTIHQDLPDFIAEIKKLGFLVKLDSNGTNPEMIKQLIDSDLINFVAMDIKGPLDKYIEIAARPLDLDAIQESIRLIINSPSIDHEFRTTIVRQQLEVSDFKSIGQLLNGAKRFALQKFTPGRTLAPSFELASSFTEGEMNQAQSLLTPYIKEVVIH